MAKRLLLILTCAFAFGVAGCGGGGDDGGPPSGDPATGSAETPAANGGRRPAVPAEPLEGRFDIGDRKLHLSCSGGGSGGPAIVYLHPYAADDSSAGGRDAGLVPDYLRERHRVCAYDRVNVGRSTDVPGRQTGADSVRDLHRLLAAARIDGPHVLLGSGVGGLLADMYAATYPQQVAGMVLVDAPLPGDLDVQERFFPPRLRVQAGAWAGTVERLDQQATFEQARRLEGDEPQVPLTYIGPEELALDPSLDRRRVTAVIRDMQARFVERFAPGRLVLLDSARPMEAVVPDRIAEEVERVMEEIREASEAD